MHSTSSARNERHGFNSNIQVPPIVHPDLLIQSVESVIHFPSATSARSTTTHTQLVQEADRMDPLAAVKARLEKYQLSQKLKRSSESDGSFLEVEIHDERRKKVRRQEQKPDDLRPDWLPKVLNNQNTMVHQQAAILARQDERLRIQETMMTTTSKVQARQNTELVKLGQLVQCQAQKVEEGTKAEREFYRRVTQAQDSQIQVLKNVVAQQIEMKNTLESHTQQISDNSTELVNVLQTVQAIHNDQNRWNAGCEAAINVQNHQIKSMSENISHLKQKIENIVEAAVDELDNYSGRDTDGDGDDDDDGQTDEKYFPTSTVFVPNDSDTEEVEMTECHTKKPSVGCDVEILPNRLLNQERDRDYDYGKVECPMCKKYYSIGYIRAHRTRHCEKLKNKNSKKRVNCK